jgi:hypothetical protein
MKKEDIQKILLQKDKEYLSELVLILLDKLEDDKRMDFTAKYINAKVVLSELNELDNDEFLEEIENFCKACDARDYYVEAEYDDYHDSYDEDDFADSEWAREFSKYFRLAVVRARNGEDKIAYVALEYLFDCINDAESDEEMLGTSSPLDYINIDAGDTLEMFFDLMLKCEKNTVAAYRKFFDMWLNFKEYCKMPVSTYVKDLPKAVEALVEMVKTGSGFSRGERIFHLIKSLHEENGTCFDGLPIVKELAQFDPDFNLYVAQEYFDGGQYEQAIETAVKYNSAIEAAKNENSYHRYNNEIPKKLKTILIDSYEKNGQPEKAYAAALEMFWQYTNYDLYKRTRHFAKMVMDLEVFIDETEEFLLKPKANNDYYSGSNKLLHRQILSFEGRRDKLIALVPKELKNQGGWGYSSGNDYALVKYIMQSLIYACAGSPEAENKSAEILLPNLSGFVAWLGNESGQSERYGISDMAAFEKDPANQERYLTEAVSILKLMAKFHIDAANRERYAKAAYYLGIFEDICKLLGKSNESKLYILSIMEENKKRRALKDEMQKKFAYLK